MDILQALNDKVDFEVIVEEIIANPSHIEILIDTIRTNPKAIKFRCEKALRLVSEKAPEVVYPYFDFFVELMGVENSFLKWGGIITVANLTSVDEAAKFDELFETYFSFVRRPQQVAATNAITGAVKIVKHKPYLMERVLDELYAVNNNVYMYKGELSPECKRIVQGEVIKALDELYEMIKDKELAIAFVSGQLTNEREKVRKKAEKFLMKHEV